MELGLSLEQCTCSSHASLQQLCERDLTRTHRSNMTNKPSVVPVGTNDSSAALPRWSQKGRDSLSMTGHDSILTHLLGNPVSKSKACSSSTIPHYVTAAQPSTQQLCHGMAQHGTSQRSAAHHSIDQASTAVVTLGKYRQQTKKIVQKHSPAML